MGGKSSKTHLKGADGLRAFACLIVLFHHVADALEYRAGPEESWIGIFVPTGGYGVVMFFVLSGFLLARPFWLSLAEGTAFPPLRTYVLRRLARIVPGYWVAMFATLVLAIALGDSVPDFQTMVRFAAGLVFISQFSPDWIFPVEINGPLWSISLEIGSYILLPAAFAVIFAMRGQVGSLAGWLALWAGVIVVAVVLHLIYVAAVGFPPPPDFAKVPFTLDMLGQIWFPRINLFSMFAIFALGSMAAGVQVAITNWQSWKADTIAAIALAASVIFLFAVDRPYRPGASQGGFLDLPYNGYPFFPAMIAIFLAFAPSSRLVGTIMDWTPLRQLASISFGIYIYHVIVLVLLQIYVFPDGSRAWEPLEFFGLVFGTLGGTIVLSYLSWTRLEKPVIDWARRFEKSGPPLADAAAPA